MFYIATGVQGIRNNLFLFPIVLNNFLHGFCNLLIRKVNNGHDRSIRVANFYLIDSLGFDISNEIWIFEN